jgi:hypothetical protein
MGWNYRVLRKKFGEEYVCEICEVYYNEEGIPDSWIWGKNVMSGDSLDDLEDTINKINVAMKKPVLEVVGEDEYLKELSDDLLEPIDGVFAIPPSNSMIKYNISELYKYARDKGIEPSSLSEEEKKQFIIK